MPTNTPYTRLVGTWTVYVAPTGEAKPDVDDAPAGNWAELGPTDGEQSVANMGRLTYFRDNDNQGPVKAVRPEEEVVATFTLVGLSLENYATILHDSGNVSTDAGPPAIKSIGLQRGFDPNEYALLLRGSLDSPYGAFPGQIYIPRCVEDGEPTMTRARDGSPGLECEFHALEDSGEAAGETLGVWEVQTA